VLGSHAWWGMLVILALMRQRRDDYKSVTHWVYIMSYRLGRATEGNLKERGKKRNRTETDRQDRQTHTHTHTHTLRNSHRH